MPVPVAALVVLAAGEGKRMRSALPKVLHPIAGRPLLGHVLAAGAALGAQRTLVVLGHGREQVAAALPELLPAAEAVVQEQQDGTGHAVRVALEAAYGGPGAPQLDPDATVVVVPGDAPLLTAGTLNELVDAHSEAGRPVTLLTTVLDDPTGYGRVVRDATGAAVRVVEERDADAPTRALREVAVSVYAFRAAELVRALGALTRDNAQGEEYLTDAVAALAGSGGVATSEAAPAEVAGVNDRAQLAAAGLALRDRLVREAMLAGVTVVDPASTWLDVDVRLEPDTTLLPNVRLHGATTVEAGAVVGPDSTLLDTTVGAGARVRNTVAEGAEIGPDADVGPFTYLRPGTRLGRGSKAGAYVEMKAADIGDGAKVPHLSYVGDAAVGPRSNIGAATVFVNYDGVDKHRTVVGADVRIGSDTMLVAPVTVGDGAYTGAGSVITEDVPPGAMGLGRARQRNVEGWVERRRAGTPAATAARRARENEPEMKSRGDA